jgi:hypothetical protein
VLEEASGLLDDRPVVLPAEETVSLLEDEVTALLDDLLVALLDDKWLASLDDEVDLLMPELGVDEHGGDHVRV